MINGRPFVNNASFGAYAEIVQSPEYRDDKDGTMLEMLPDLLSGHQGRTGRPHRRRRGDDGPQARAGQQRPLRGRRLAGLGRRARLDQGVLGVIAARVSSAAQAVGLLPPAHSGRGCTVFTGAARSSSTPTRRRSRWASTARRCR